MNAAVMDENLNYGEQQPETITQLRQQLVIAQEAAKHNAEQGILSGVQLINEKQKTQILFGLIEQMLEWHCNPKSPRYKSGGTPETECDWCQEARQILREIEPDLGRL